MKPTIKQRWTPFKVAQWIGPSAERKRTGSEALMKNGTHTVILSGDDRCKDPLDGWVLLSIRRNDRAAECDWRIFMRIKNELVGPDREAIQLFPGLRRVVDTANQYFLFVAPKGYIFGVGQFEQEVSDEQWASSVGATQRPFTDGDPLQALVNNAPRSERVDYFPIPLYPEGVIDLMKKAHADTTPENTTK